MAKRHVININKVLEYDVPSNTQSTIPTKESVIDSIYSQNYQVATGIFDKKNPNVTGSSIPFVNNIQGDIIAPTSGVNVMTYLRMYEKDDVIFERVYNIMAYIVSTIKEYKHPKKEIQKTVNMWLKKIRTLNGGTFHDIKMNVASKIWAGFSIQECEFDYDYDTGYYYIKMTYPLPPSTIGYKVKPEGEIKCVLQSLIAYLPYQMQNLGNMQYPLLGGIDINRAYSTMNDDLNIDRPYSSASSPVNPYANSGTNGYPIRVNTVLPIGVVEINKDKCIIAINNIGYNSGDPNGYSILDNCYNPWLLKCQVQASLSIAIDKAARPTTVCYYNPQYNFKNVDGTRVTAQQAIQGMADVHIDSFIALPGMPETVYKLEVLKNEADIPGINASIDKLNDRLKNALFGAEVMESNSYSSDVKKGSTNEISLNNLRDSVCHDLLGIVQKLFDLNFDPEEYDYNVGEFAIVETNMLKLLQSAKVVETNAANKVYDPTNPEDVKRARAQQGYSVEYAEELAKKNEENINSEQQKVNIDDAKPNYKNQGDTLA